MSENSATAFAPATCGNVCVGFDTLGLCYTGVGDIVSVSKQSKKGISIAEIKSKDPLPLDPKKNTAGVVLEELCKLRKLDYGLSVSIEKGIRSSSGMGGSAASAVGALTAANALLEHPLTKEEVLQISLKGEEISCGSAHADNVAPCIFGGQVLIWGSKKKNIKQIPFPTDWTILLTHPEVKVSTAAARRVLKENFSLETISKHNQKIAGYISSCYTGDNELLMSSFQDLITEKERAPLTPGYLEIKSMALEEGALGHSLSGSGPAQLTICPNQEIAENIRHKVKKIYSSKNIECKSFIGPINTQGTHLI